MVSSLALKVLSSGETRALEIGKNETSLKLKQSDSKKSDNDLQIQLERSQKAMRLLEKKFDEQSEELAKMRAEIKSLKLNSEKNLTSPVLNSSDSKKVVNYWFYLLLGSFFALAVGIGFILFKRARPELGKWILALQMKIVIIKRKKKLWFQKAPKI